MNIPDLQSVVYSNSRITATWLGSGTSYTLTLFRDGTAVQSVQAAGGVGFISNPVFDDTSVFSVAVAENLDGGGTGPYSIQAAVIIGPPLDVQVAYDGASIAVHWQPPAGATVARGAEIDLLQGTTVISGQGFVGTQATFTPSPPLDSTQSYSVTVRGQSGISSGPNATAVAIVQNTPKLSKLTYSTSETTSRLTAVTDTLDSTNQGLGVYLYIDGVQEGSGTGTGLQAVLSLDFLLDPGQSNQVRLARLATSSRGPLSNAVPVVVEPPLLTAVAYDGAKLSAAWSFLPNTPPATAATITVFDASNTAVGGRELVGSSGSFPLALTPGAAYTASATASRAGSAGPRNSPLHVVTSVPALSSAAYDGTRLHVAWSNANDPGVTGTLIHLQAGGVNITPASPSGGPSGIVSIALDPAGAYAVALQAAGTSALGPLSSPTTLISAAPSITGVTYATGTPDQVTVTWNAGVMATRAGVTGYSVQLYENGASKGSVVTISDKATGTVDVPATLDPWKSYTVTVQATGTNVTGPPSVRAAVVAATPSVASVVYDGTSVVVTWTAAADAGGTGFTAQLVDSNDTVVDSVSTSGLSAKLALTPAQGEPYTARVCTVSGASTGAWSRRVAVLLETLTLGSASFEGAFLELEWAAAAETVSGYELRVYQGGVLLSVVPVSGGTTTKAQIYQPLDPAGAATVTVRPVAGVSLGKESDALALISATPSVTRTAYATDRVTVTWNADVTATRAGVTGYSVQLHENGAPKGRAVAISDKDTGTADIPATLDPWKRYSVTVQATGTNVTGAMSSAEGVIASSPVITSAAISGFGWSLAWTAAREPFVTGYEVVVTDAQGKSAQTFYTSETSLALPNTFSGNQSLATVRAVGAIAAGPPSAAVNLYGRGASYYFSATGSSAPAYLFRASSQPAGASTINLYLPDLFNNLPSIQNDVFVLTRPATSASYPFLITIARDSVAWQFTSTARAALWNAYLQFLTDLDVMVDSQPQLKPGAFNLITQVLGRALPLLFSEQLSYVYRFDAANGYIDLVPGMRLRVDSEARQYSGPPSTTNVNINGFVASGTSVFELGEYWQGSRLNTGFSSYLSLTGRPAVSSTTTTGGAAGGLDFYPALNRMPLFRLLYPARFPATNSNGSAELTDNIVIIGANLFGDLQGATAQYITSGNFGGYESKISQTWFRGRAVITPELPVFINGAREYFAVGTTVRQLLGLFGGGAYPAGGYVGGLAFRRAVNNIIDSVDVAVPPEAVRANDVRIADLALNAYSGGGDALDLPLLQGDSFTFGGAIQV